MEPLVVPGMSSTAIIITLPDGTTHRAIEVEVETRFEGPSYLGTDVPYVCPVNWRDGADDIKPHTVRLFALVEDGRSEP